MSYGLGAYLAVRGQIDLTLENIKEIASFSVVLMVFAVPISLVLGVPGFFLLKRFNMFHAWLIGALGALAGWVVWLTPLGFTPMIACIGQGFVTAGIAWLLLSLCGLSSR